MISIDKSPRNPCVSQIVQLGFYYLYTITKEKDDFKILQLTDIHLGGSALSYDKDLKALKTIYSLLERTKPDFVIVTGDLTFPVR